MQRTLILVVLLTAGCGSKAPPAALAAPEPAATEPAAAPEPPPEPVAPAAPAEPEPPASNADFQASLTYADGRQVSGHVVRVERSEDWFAEKGWTDRPIKLTVGLEGGGKMVEPTWEQIRTVAISYGAKSDLDCMYDSDYQPYMYMCTLRSTAKVQTADGKSWEASARHKWQFTFEDGSQESFFVHKLPVRRQDDQERSHDESLENYEMYAALQTEALELAKHAVTRIEITP